MAILGPEAVQALVAKLQATYAEHARLQATLAAAEDGRLGLRPARPHALLSGKAFHGNTMSVATLSSKAQVVLPAEVRRRLGLRPGDRLVIEVEDDHVVIRKAPSSDVDALAALRSELWRGYAHALEQARDEWER